MKLLILNNTLITTDNNMLAVNIYFLLAIIGSYVAFRIWKGRR